MRTNTKTNLMTSALTCLVSFALIIAFVHFNMYLPAVVSSVVFNIVVDKIRAAFDK